MKNRYMWRKRLAVSLSAALCWLGMTGCLPADSQPQQGAQPILPQPAPQSEEPAQPGTKQLLAMLPSDQETLGQVLQQVAAAEGISLTIQKAAAGTGYTAAVQQALEEQAPGLVFLEDARVLEQEDSGLAMQDLLSDGSTALVRALADMVPTALRAGTGRVYGLPVGGYTEGVLVNLELLGALLGSGNQGELLRDLTACSWDEWQILVLALEEYLKSPGRYQVKLDGRAYTTPAYRPQTARGVRGMYALADADGDTLLQNSLTVALAALYAAEDWPLLSEAQQSDVMRNTLGPLLEELEFETMHMTREEGIMFRGEAYAERDKLTQEQAVELFANGTALLLKGDSKLALQLEQERVDLAQKLAVVPLKLPPPPVEEEEQKEQDNSDESELEGDNSTDADGGQGDEQVAPEVDMNAEITKHNRRLWMASDGVLCIPKSGENREVAELLLLRLFTDEEGIRALEEQLHLQVFTTALGTQPLREQLFMAMNGGEGVLLPVLNLALGRSESTIGNHVRDELLSLEEWGEEEIQGFLTASFAALGMTVESGNRPESGGVA